MARPILRMHTGVLAYARTLDVWGKSGKFDVILPYSQLSGSAMFAGQPHERKVTGLQDPLFRFSVNFYGAPALSLKEFADYRQDLIIGASVQVSAPLGQYDDHKLVNLEIGLMPELVVTNIALANVPGGSQPQMIEIEKLQAQVRLLLPLLLKDVAVQQIGLFGVKVLLETDSDAWGNWDFFAGDSSAGSPGWRKSVEIDVDRVIIENLHFTFRRHKTGSQTQFTLVSLVMNRQASEDELTLKLQADYNGQPVTLSGKTGGVRQLLAHKRFTLELSGSLTNAAIKINGAIDDVLTLQGIDLEAQLIGKDMAALEPFLDIQLPNTKAFDVTAEVKGSKVSLKLENVKGNMSGSGFDLAVSGSIGDLIAMSSVDLKLKSSGKDLAEIGPIIGEKLPVTDGFTCAGPADGFH